MPQKSFSKMIRNIKKTEAATLGTFKKHRPSEYFSHLGTKRSFLQHDYKVERLYRFGLTFPPEMFAKKKLIDLGAGTGEHTVSLARWGARCTLVEMNDDALRVARKNFRKHTKNYRDHKFIHSSLYDINLKKYTRSFDISHSRGVFTHVADKRKAFKILAALAKPGGYVIFGDRNTCGGVQEMLQRLAIYRLGGQSDEKIVEIAETLFSEDIDRSQNSVPRTRKAIIFDRWVIQQQDDPSVEEILAFFKDEGLEYVSSWPKIDYAGRGTSTHSNPIISANLIRGALSIELLWMILKDGERENIQAFELHKPGFFNEVGKVARKLRNLQIKTKINVSKLTEDFSNLIEIEKKSRLESTDLYNRLATFLLEAGIFLKMIQEKKKLSEIRKKIKEFTILFKGYAGVRHVDFVAYKPK